MLEIAIIVGLYILFLFIPNTLRARNGISGETDIDVANITTIPNERKVKTYTDFVLPLIIILSIIGFILSLGSIQAVVGVLVIMAPILIGAGVLIDHYLGYRKNIIVESGFNDFENREVKVDLLNGQTILLNRDTVKTIVSHSVEWKTLPWSKYGYLNITLRNDDQLTINSLEIDVDYVALILTHYEIRILEVEAFSARL